MLELLMSANTEKSVINLLPAPSNPNNWISQMGMCVSENKDSIYFAGGIGTNPQYNRSVMRYDILKRGYQNLPDLPDIFTMSNWVQLWHHNNKLYVYRANNWAVLDLLSLKWSILPTPTNLTYFSSYGGVTFNNNGRLLVYGAPAGTGFRNTLSEYFPETNMVKLITTNVNVNKFTYPAATILNDYLYVSGGSVDKLFSCNLTTNIWESVTTPIIHTTKCLSGYGDKIYLMGTDELKMDVITYDIVNKVYGSAPKFNRNLVNTVMVTIDNMVYAMTRGELSSYLLE